MKAIGQDPHFFHKVGHPFADGVSRSLLGKLAAVFLLSLMLVACQGNQAKEPPQVTQPPEPEPEVVEVEAPPPSLLNEEGRVRVALLLPMTGRAAVAGEGLARAAEMALFEIAGDELELMQFDTSGDPARAAAATQEAINQGAQLILGPLFAESVRSAGPIAQLSGVPMIAFSNNRAVSAPGVFVMGVAPESEIQRVVTYALDQGIINVAGLAPTGAYGDGVLQSLNQTLQSRGLPPSQQVRYQSGQGDLEFELKLLGEYDERAAALAVRRQELRNAGDSASKAALKRLEDSRTLGPPSYQALVLPVGGQELQQIAPLLPFYDIDPADVKFLGSRLWEDDTLGREPALVGGWFAAPDRFGWQAFSDRYRSFYGEDPIRISTLAYDGVALAAVMLREAQNGNRVLAYPPEEITRTQGFAGVDGLIRFLPGGSSQRGLAVYEVQRASIVVIDPAPTAFQDFVN